jgi:chlorophyllide a reductase subunit X
MKTPDLVIGHGIVGRLTARLIIAMGNPAPTVWEINPARKDGADGYEVTTSEACKGRTWSRPCSTPAAILTFSTRPLPCLIAAAKSFLAGFYSETMSFRFTPAFMREAKFPHRAGQEGNPDHRHLRQGRHRQELHAGQPVLHDGPAGQEGAADRLRSQSDTTSLLFGGKSCPTIIETSSKKKAAGEEVTIGDVCFKRDGVFAMELGGPEVGRGCGGRGIIHGFELLEKLGFHDWDFDYVLLDFLGDVVCGGFGLPIARDMCQKVIVVGSNDLQSLYVANNVCSAVQYFRKLGGNVGVAGMVINKDDGTGEAAGLRRSGRHSGSGRDPADDDIRRKSANYEIIGKPDGRGARCSRTRHQCRPSPAGASRRRWTRTACSACSSSDRPVARLRAGQPAKLEDMCPGDR